MQQELNQGDECCNDDDIARQLDLFRIDFPQQADNQVGENQNESGRKSHADAVKCSGGNCQSRTHSEQRNQGWIFPNQSFCKFFSVIHDKITSLLCAKVSMAQVTAAFMPLEEYVAPVMPSTCSTAAASDSPTRWSVSNSGLL